MEKKFEVSEKYSILLKARHFIIYAVLCNVQNWVSWLRISKMNRSKGIENFNFRIEKVFKKYRKCFF